MSDSTQQGTQQGTEQHITVKNPGRVAQGHKLAALMKKRKEELKHSSGDSSISSNAPSTAASTSSSSNAVLGATAVTVIVIVGVGVWYKFFNQHGIQQHQPEKSSEKPVEVADYASKKVQNQK